MDRRWLYDFHYYGNVGRRSFVRAKSPRASRAKLSHLQNINANLGSYDRGAYLSYDKSRHRCAALLAPLFAYFSRRAKLIKNRGVAGRTRRGTLFFERLNNALLSTRIICLSKFIGKVQRIRASAPSCPKQE